jgi:hypothetical protein
MALWAGHQQSDTGPDEQGRRVTAVCWQISSQKFPVINYPAQQGTGAFWACRSCRKQDPIFELRCILSEDLRLAPVLASAAARAIGAPRPVSGRPS